MINKSLLHITFCLFLFITNSLFFNLTLEKYTQSQSKYIEQVIINEIINSNNLAISKKLSGLSSKMNISCIRAKSDSLLFFSYGSNCKEGILFNKVIIKKEENAKYSIVLYIGLPVDIQVFFIFFFIVILGGSFMLFYYSRRVTEVMIESELSKERALHALSSRIAHDIRSPLAVLRTLIKESDSPIIHRALNRLESIAEDILVERKKGSIQQINIYKTIENIINEKILLNKKILLKNNVKKNISVKGIQGNLEAIISNIFNNSIEAGARLISISTFKEKDNLTIRIKDDGPGFKDLNILNFDKVKVNQDKNNSNGIGLQSAKDYCKEFEGGIKIGNESGAFVELTFPSFPSIEIKSENKLTILIDDDKYVRAAWQMTYEESNLDFIAFSSIEEFQLKKDILSKDTIIYIDSDLGNNIKGEEFALTLFNEGFSNLNLATGHDPCHFSDTNHLMTIIGKEPPI